MTPETMLSRCLDAAIYDRDEDNQFGIYDEYDDLEPEESYESDGCWQEDR